jgi:CHAT domain-containing protein
MQNKLFILIATGLLYINTISGQCSDPDSLWKKLVYLRDSSGLSVDSQLRILLAEESRMNSCPDHFDSAHAFLMRRIGMSYLKLYDYLMAVKYYRRSIDIINTHLSNPAINPKHLVLGYYGLAVIYDSLNSIREKMAALDSCFTVATRYHSVDIFCLSSIYKRVEYFYDVGDYHRCIEYASRCERLAGKFASLGKTEYRIGYEYASSSLAWQVNSMVILNDFGNVEKLLIDKINAGKSAAFIFNLGTLHAQLAEIEEHKGNYTKALYYFNRAFYYDHKMGDDVICKSILNLIGTDIYLKHYKDPDKALQYYRSALVFGKKDRFPTRLDSIESLSILDNIANIFVDKGMFDSAFRYFHLAFEQVRPGADELSILYRSLDEFGRQKKIENLTALFIDKGNAYFQLYKISGNRKWAGECLRIYKITDKLLDRIKSEQIDLESKLFWRADSRRLYEHAIDACYSYGNANDAFYFFEKSRAVLLNDQLNEQRWLGAVDIQKQTQSKRRILQFQRELALVNNSSAQFDELRNQLFNEEQQLDHLEQVIKLKNPLYYQSFIDTTELSIDDVQKKILTDHHALVELFEGDSAVYSFVLTKNGVYLNRMDKPMYDSLSRDYMKNISNPSLINSNFSAFAKASRKLFQLIFGTRHLPTGRIVISPDGQYFPFESLVTSREGEPLNYFLENYAVTYTYSARYMMSQFTSNSSGESFFGMAPVLYPAHMQLASLNGSDKSLAKLKTYFREGNILYQTNASKTNFLNQFYKYRIIQLYTHASINGTNGEPVIYFSDSAMNLSDLLIENKPTTSLIVLSACETGVGKEYKGEGVFSFNRGFASLGIPASITNLWDVDNNSTYQITELFYKYLSKGLPIDIALQKAKLEFIRYPSNKNKLPYYWAASILVGKSDALINDKPFPWKDLLVVLSLTGLSFFAWKKWTKK